MATTCLSTQCPLPLAVFRLSFPPSPRLLQAEVMFETFNVPALHIGVQAVLALYSSWAVAEQRDAVGGCR